MFKRPALNIYFVIFSLLLIQLILFTFSARSSEASMEKVIDFQLMLAEMTEYTRSQVGIEPHPETTHIAKKYIPLGMDQGSLVAQCKQNDWGVRDLTHSPNTNPNDLKEFDAIITCHKKVYLNWWNFWGHTCSISTRFKEKKLARLRAHCYYSHPLF